jgi:hypothetical protein
MNKSKWYEILVIIFICITCLPLFLFFVLIKFFQDVFAAPFEYRKYKRSKYYAVYKRKYKIGITREFDYLLHNKLLAYDIHLDGIKKSYGYMGLVNDDFCFALCDITDLKNDDGDIQINLREDSPYFSLDTFIENEKNYYTEECINREFRILIWREEDEYIDVLSDELNNSLLQNKGIYFYTTEDELANIIKEIISNNE